MSCTIRNGMGILVICGVVELSLYSFLNYLYSLLPYMSFFCVIQGITLVLLIIHTFFPLSYEGSRIYWKNTINQLKVCCFKILLKNIIRQEKTKLYSTVTLRQGEKKHYNHKVDAYSFAIVLWELIHNKLPFEGMSNLQAAYAAAFKVDNFLVIQCLL